MKSIKAIFYKLKNNIFWRSVVILVSGTALAQLIGVFTTPWSAGFMIRKHLVSTH